MPVDVVPTGSLVVGNLDPASTVLKEAYDEIMQRYLHLEMTDDIFEDYWRTNAPLEANGSLAALRALGYWR